MATRPSRKSNSTLTGTNANDTFTVKHTKITVNGLKGNDIIKINAGANHRVYGGAGNDTITIGKSVSTGLRVYGDDAKSKLTGNDKFNINGGSKNYYYGGKGTDKFTISAGTSNYLYGGAGTDTFTVNGGSSNNLYGGAGVDTYVIGKNSTGTATVKDFAASDKVKVTGNTSNIYASKNNIIIKGGINGKAALTLVNAKKLKNSFTVTDSNSNLYTYKVTSGVVGATLKEKMVNGYNVAGYTAAPFVTTIDARKVTTDYVTVTGNAKANTIYVTGKGGFGSYKGGKGKDTIIMGEGYKHSIDGGEGGDTITIKGGSNCIIDGGAGDDGITITDGKQHEVYGGSGSDTIAVQGGGAGRYHYKIYGGAGNDTITIKDNTGDEQSVYGDAGNDTITVNAGTNHKIYGDDIDGRDTGDDTIIINKGSHSIDGGLGNDQIYVNSGAGKQIISSGSGNDTITINAGSDHKIYSGDGKDNIVINLSDKIGTFRIYVSEKDTIDNLSINGAKFDELDFRHETNQYGANDLHITSKIAGSDIIIDHWTSWQPFSEGTIKFGGVQKSVADINRKAGII